MKKQQTNQKQQPLVLNHSQLKNRHDLFKIRRKQAHKSERGGLRFLSHSAQQGKKTAANICIDFMVISESVKQKETLSEKAHRQAWCRPWRSEPAAMERWRLGLHADDSDGDGVKCLPGGLFFLKRAPPPVSRHTPLHPVQYK